MNDNHFNNVNNPEFQQQSNFQSLYRTNPYSANMYNNQPQFQKPYIKPQAVYTESDRIFSIIALILGFTTLKVLIHMFGGIGFMTTLLCLGLTLFNYFFSKKQGLKGSKENTVIFVVTLLLSVLFVITDNDYVKSINFCLVLISNLYFVYAGYKSNNNSVIYNVFKAVVISPFYEYGSLFNALFQKPKHSLVKKSDKSQKNILPVIIGLVLSVPVCAVVMALLMSSDENFGRVFERIFEKIFTYFFDDLFTNGLQLMFSLPISMYIFGAVFSRSYKMKHENELRKLSKASVRLLPSSMCNAFLSPLILIYIAFVFTQISYLITNVVSANDTFDYSAYARSGFFELCFVAIINLSVISVIMFFVKLKNKLLPKSVKIFIIAFSVLTLCLIITAVIKMQMYINMYGMTPLRVYTSIFMIYLFVMFIVMIIKQFVFGISFTKIAYMFAVFIIAAMSLLPVDGFIAKYNITKYEQGEIDWIGYDAMTDLDASAVGVFAECDPNMVSEKSYSGVTTYPIRKYFNNQYDLKNISIYDFNLTRFFAAKKIKEFQQNDNINNYKKEQENIGIINFPEEIKSFDDDGYMKIIWQGRKYTPYCVVSKDGCNQVIGYVDGDKEDIVSAYSDYPAKDWIVNYLENEHGAILYKEENCTDIPDGLTQEYY